MFWRRRKKKKEIYFKLEVFYVKSGSITLEFDTYEEASDYGDFYINCGGVMFFVITEHCE